MADAIAVAQKRAKGLSRLMAASEKLSAQFGIEIKKPAVPRNRYPDLHDAQFIDSIADWAEELLKQQKARSL